MGRSLQKCIILIKELRFFSKTPHYNSTNILSVFTAVVSLSEIYLRIVLTHFFNPFVYIIKGVFVLIFCLYLIYLICCVSKGFGQTSCNTGYHSVSIFYFGI